MKFKLIMTCLIFGLAAAVGETGEEEKLSTSPEPPTH